MFTYQLISDECKTTLRFEGDVDIDITEVIEQDITPKLTNCGQIELDMSKVPFVDSSGIGLLITMVNTLTEAGSKVTICGLTEEVKQIFTFLQLPEILGKDVFTQF